MNQVNIDSIVDYIKTIPEVVSVCGSRIFSEAPINEQEGIYLIVGLVSDVVDTPITKNALIEIRALAHNKGVAQSQLYSLINIITDHIVSDDLQEDFGFGVYKVIEKSFSPPLMDDKSRREIVKDYLFYFSL